MEKFDNKTLKIKDGNFPYKDLPEIEFDDENNVITIFKKKHCIRISKIPISLKNHNYLGTVYELLNSDNLFNLVQVVDRKWDIDWLCYWYWSNEDISFRNIEAYQYHAEENTIEAHLRMAKFSFEDLLIMIDDALIENFSIFEDPSYKKCLIENYYVYRINKN